MAECSGIPFKFELRTYRMCRPKCRLKCSLNAPPKKSLFQCVNILQLEFRFYAWRPSFLMSI